MNNELLNHKIFRAIECDNIEDVKSILVLEKINPTSYYGAKSILHATELGNLELLNILLECSKNIPRLSFWSNKYRISAITLLHAAKSKRFDILKLLLNYGANANKKDLNEAFIETLISGNYEAIKLMVESGVNVNIKDSKGITPLIYAILLSDLDQKSIIECLLFAGAYVNVKCKFYITCDKKTRIELNTPLTYAKRYCSQDIFEMIKNSKKSQTTS